MADIVDRDVIVLAPEKGDGGKFLAATKHIERSRLALALCHHPMLDANLFAGVRIGPASNVASGEDAGDARFEIGVDDDTSINNKPRAFGEFDSWVDADTSDYEICLDCTTALELHLLTVDRSCRVLE